jgi:hypothetical protein
MEVTSMKFDLQKRYADAKEFFALRGSVVMKLSPEAAIAVCNEATARGFVVARVEGGIWHDPGFEARMDCIWDGAEPPVGIEKARENNVAAAEFIRSEEADHDVFLITAPSMSGW